MSGPTNNTVHVEGGGVLVALVELHVARYLDARTEQLADEPRFTPSTVAQAVYEHVEALEREGEVRVVRRRVEEAAALLVWLREHRDDRNVRKEASKRCVSFGMGLAPSTDATSRAFGLLLSELAQKVTPGAIDERAIDEFAGLVDRLVTALVLDHSRLVAKAPGRRPDGWTAGFPPK